MFGSVYATKGIIDRLNTVAGVTAVVADRIYGVGVVPQGAALPAAIVYPEFSSYGGAIGYRTEEVVRMVVRFIDEGGSIARILPAAQAALDALDGAHESVTADGATYQWTYNATGEVPITTVMDGATVYRQLGTLYEFQITRS